MPRALDPNDTFDVVLDSDKDKSPQPAFVFRAATGRQWRQMAVALESPEPDIEKYCDILYDAARLTMVDWRNMESIPFAAGSLEDIVSPIEVRELLRRALDQGELDAEAKKNSESGP